MGINSSTRKEACQHHVAARQRIAAWVNNLPSFPCARNAAAMPERRHSSSITALVPSRCPVSNSNLTCSCNSSDSNGGRRDGCGGWGRGRVRRGRCRVDVDRALLDDKSSCPVVALSRHIGWYQWRAGPGRLLPFACASMYARLIEGMFGISRRLSSSDGRPPLDASLEPVKSVLGWCSLCHAVSCTPDAPG